jgi:ubiquinone/menaquinone biosynthesis C-methylase UbiE
MAISANRTMDRDDFSITEFIIIFKELNNLIKHLYRKGLYMTSWYGTLPSSPKRQPFFPYFKNALEIVGQNNRGYDYKPLRNVADDARIPWYLYWEIAQVLTMGPELKGDSCILDAGGTSSLCSCYLASLGVEVHSIDINPELIANANKIAKVMEWKLYSYKMDMAKLDFEDDFFDHSYSICVFEHLNYGLKQNALKEISRCNKKGSILSITFDYKNPAPSIAFAGFDKSPENQLSTFDDISRNFLSTNMFELYGNKTFYDNNKNYLVHPEYNNAPYTFGSIFLRNKK